MPIITRFDRLRLLSAGPVFAQVSDIRAMCSVRLINASMLNIIREKLLVESRLVALMSSTN
jgi:hypothetical protein